MTSDQMTTNEAQVPGEEQVEPIEAQPAVAEELTGEELFAQQQQTIQDLEEQVKRVSAEFQNFRRRQEEEQKRVSLRLKDELFRSLLPILDNLERALAASQVQGSAEALIKGVELVDRDIRKIFEDHGVAALAAEGEPFDPAYHEAVMTEERDDVPDQTVVQELQTGYVIGGRVLRPSLVKVARS